MSYSPGSGASDATNTSKGIVQLAGDLSGSAASPTVSHHYRVINVRDYGALGNNSNDDWAAMQAAVNDARQGDTVYVPRGQYRLTQPLTLRYGVLLKGNWSGHFLPRVDADTYIKPFYGSFNGNALIVIAKSPDSSGTYTGSDLHGGVRVEGISLTGVNALNTSSQPIDAVYLSPNVHDVQLDKLSIYNFSGRGVVTDGASGTEFSQVAVSTCKGVGFEWLDSSGAGNAMADTYVQGCYSQANAGGFKGLHPNAAVFIGCRAEFNTGHGFEFNGTHYSLMLTACNTDRNKMNGFHQRLLGTRPVMYTNCLAKRDGGNDETNLIAYAGFDLAGTGTTPSLLGCGAKLTGCSAQTGSNDTGTGIVSPKYGIATSNILRVSLANSFFVGVTAPIFDTANIISHDSTITTGIANASSNAITFNDDSLSIANGAASQRRSHQIWTRGAGKRWEFGADATTEDGSNAGSDFFIERFTDSGVAIDTPLVIKRSTGEVTFNHQIHASSGVAIASTGRLDVAGTMSLPATTISASTVLTSGAAVVTLCNANTGAITVTLPAANANNGQVLIVKKIDSSANQVLVSAPNGMTIDGTSSQAITAPYGAIRLISDGVASWYSI